jgi:hypothetical protein
MVNLFKRLDAGRPPPVEAANKLPHSNLEPAQKLLDFLQQHWTKPTITSREICRSAPNAIRNQKNAINSAKILVKEGWLIPNQTRRRDMHEWLIVRKPIVHPTVATKTAE